MDLNKYTMDGVTFVFFFLVTICSMLVAFALWLETKPGQKWFREL